jgi:hypothetical protein
MLKGLLCLDSKLDRVVMLLADEARGYGRGGSISWDTPQGREGGVVENPDGRELGV